MLKLIAFLALLATTSAAWADLMHASAPELAGRAVGTALGAGIE
jgi:hypothetical protein